MSFKMQTKPPKKCDGFIIEQMDGEVVLLHPGKNIIIHSNETAALIWQLCDGINTVTQIIDLLASAYPDARAIEFPVKVAKDGEAVITYRVRYSW